MLQIKRFLPLLVFVLFVCLAWVGLKHDPHELPSPLIGRPMPNFSLPSILSTQPTITQTIFQGHVTVLHVFASWCITCRSEHPVIADLAREAKGVQVIGLAYKDDPASLMSWLQASGNPYYAIINDQAGTLALNLGVYGTPETFIIDKQGIIRDKIIGAISPEKLQNNLLPELQVVLRK